MSVAVDRSEFLTVAEVAAVMRLSPRQIRNYCAAGLLSHVRLNPPRGQILIPRSELAGVGPQATRNPVDGSRRPAPLREM